MISFAVKKSEWNEPTCKTSLHSYKKSFAAILAKCSQTELIQHISSVSCYYRAIVPCLSKDLEKHNVLVWEKHNVSGQTVHLILFGFKRKK